MKDHITKKDILFEKSIDINFLKNTWLLFITNVRYLKLKNINFEKSLKDKGLLRCIVKHAKKFSTSNITSFSYDDNFKKKKNKLFIAEFMNWIHKEQINKMLKNYF